MGSIWRNRYQCATCGALLARRVSPVAMILCVVLFSPLLFMFAVAMAAISLLALNDLLVAGVNPSPLLSALFLATVAVLSVGVTLLWSWRINSFVYANDDFV
ncbi:MAG: hypothetical protein AAFQ62_15930 [Pseudomonadota bacterium]